MYNDKITQNKDILQNITKILNESVNNFIYEKRATGNELLNLRNLRSERSGGGSSSLDTTNSSGSNPGSGGGFSSSDGFPWKRRTKTPEDLENEKKAAEEDARLRQEWEQNNPYEAEKYRREEQKEQEKQAKRDAENKAREEARNARRSKQREWHSNKENVKKAVDWDTANPMPVEPKSGRDDGMIGMGPNQLESQRKARKEWRKQKAEWIKKRREAGIEDMQDTDWDEEFFTPEPDFSGLGKAFIRRIDDRKPWQPKPAPKREPFRDAIPKRESEPLQGGDAAARVGAREKPRDSAFPLVPRNTTPQKVPYGQTTSSTETSRGGESNPLQIGIGINKPKVPFKDMINKSKGLVTDKRPFDPNRYIR